MLTRFHPGIAELEREESDPRSPLYRCTWCAELERKTFYEGRLVMSDGTERGFYFLPLPARELFDTMHRRRRVHEQRGKRVLYFELTTPAD